MKTPTYSILLLGSFAATSQAAVTIFADDFDTNIGGPATSSGMSVSILDSTTVAALGAGRGQVAEIDISTGGQWGAFNVPGGTAIPLPATTVAGVDTYTLSMDIFVPMGSTVEAGTNDNAGVLMRLNGTTPDYFPGGSVLNSSQLSDVTNQDRWITISNTVTIPEFNNVAGGGFDTTPVTSLLPIFSIRDGDGDGVNGNPFVEGAPGTFAYLDNLSLSVTESVPEPSSAILGLLGAVLMLRRRR